MLVIRFDYDKDLDNWCESEDKEVKFIREEKEIIMNRKELDIIFNYNMVVNEYDYDLFLFMEDMEDYVSKLE